MIYNGEYETLPHEALEALRLKRLQAQMERVHATVPSVGPGDITTPAGMDRR